MLERTAPMRKAIARLGVSGFAHQIVQEHLAFAFDLHRAASFEHKRIAYRQLGFVGDLDSTSAAMRFHARGGVHGVAPDS